MGKLIGHFAAQLQPLQAEIKKLNDKKVITAEEYEELRKRSSLERFQAEITPHVARYLHVRPAALVALSDGIAEAKANTFDQSGARKVTPLFPVYSQILQHWWEIEKCLARQNWQNSSNRI